MIKVRSDRTLSTIEVLNATYIFVLLILLNFIIIVNWFQILLQLLFAFKFYVDEMWLLPQDILSAINSETTRDWMIICA